MVELNPNLHFLSTFEGAEEERFPVDEQAILDHVNDKVAAKASLSELMEFLFGAGAGALPLRPHRPGLPG